MNRIFRQNKENLASHLHPRDVVESHVRVRNLNKQIVYHNVPGKPLVATRSMGRIFYSDGDGTQEGSHKSVIPVLISMYLCIENVDTGFLAVEFTPCEAAESAALALNSMVDVTNPQDNGDFPGCASHGDAFQDENLDAMLKFLDDWMR